MASARKELSNGNGTAPIMSSESGCNVPMVASQQAVLEKLKTITSVKIGKYMFDLDVGDLDEFYIEKARKELRETPEVVADALKRIRVLVAEEKDLVVPDEDEFYQKFLRPCKWYPESACGLMKRFFRFRLDHPKVAQNLLPSTARLSFVKGNILPLPLRTKQGERLLLIEAGSKWNPKEVSLDQMFKTVMLALDGAISEPKTQVSGVHVLINVDGMTLTHITYFTPSFAAMLTEWVQKCVPARLKAIHIINQPFIFNMVFALFKPFLVEKIRKRIHFHGRNRNKLFEMIDKAAVPTALGGELELPDEPFGEDIAEFFCKFEEDFRIGNKYGYLSKN